MTSAITRRRFIGITAAAAGLALLPFGRETRAGGAATASWRGIALGAAASLQIHHPDRAVAEALIERSRDELHRLEQLFSLYRADSALTALNRDGGLVAPPAELVELLREARRIAELTGGAFDPTVQPLWALYASHFSKPDAAPEGPSAAELQAALSRIGHDRLLVSRDRVALTTRGMAVTLNGIAQGYITDRIVAILRAGGVAHSLVDMGEARALGPRPDGRPWTVGLADPDQPERIATTLPLVDEAAATSGGYGFRFDAAGRFNHLLDPKTGRSPARYRSVTVIMPSATEADAFSTAFSLLPEQAIHGILKQHGRGRAYLTAEDGRQMILSA